MQKVDRQKHRERKHVRLPGLLLCTALLIAGITAGLLLRNRAHEEPDPGRQPVTGAITQRSEEDLQSLTVTQRGKEPWTLVRSADGSLKLQEENSEDPEQWPLDENLAYALSDAAVNLTYEDVFTENRADWEEHAADFGLNDPLITAVIRFTDGTEITARVGDSADPDDDAYYYLTVDGDDRLFAIASGTVQDLNTEKELLRPVQRLDIRGALLDRITVSNADGSVRTEWALQGQITDQDAAENWLLTAPYTYPADYDAMKNLRDSAENLRLGVHVGQATEEIREQCGLNEPTAVIELHMAAGSTGTVSSSGVYDVEDWQERTEKLTVGASKSDMVAYVRYGDDVYTISHFSLEAFNAEPLSTIARYVVATPLNSLESVTLESAGADPVNYSLVRTDNEAADESGETAFRCLKNGEEISSDAFSAAWERLLTVTISGRLPEGFEPAEAHTKYTFRTVSGGTHTVELSSYDAMHDAVTLDGHTRFYLIRNGMTDLP